MNLLETEIIKKDFGEFLKEARQQKGLSQLEVATLGGITQSHYCYIESGKREPSFTTALNLCGVLGINFNKFLKDEMKKARSSTEE